jgi:hypothetical protein
LHVGMSEPERDFAQVPGGLQDGQGAGVTQHTSKRPFRRRAKHLPDVYHFGCHRAGKGGNYRQMNESTGRSHWPSSGGWRAF